MRSLRRPLRTEGDGETLTGILQRQGSRLREMPHWTASGEQTDWVLGDKMWLSCLRSQPWTDLCLNPEFCRPPNFCLFKPVKLLF